MAFKSIKYYLHATEAHYHAWQSRYFQYTRYGRKLRKCKGIHTGERCFIVANGPSLKTDDLEKIRQNGDISFGMNRIYKVFPETRWRPTYYVCEDVNIFHHAVDDINGVPAIGKFIPIQIKWFEGMIIKNALYFWANYIREQDWPNSFSPSIDKSMDSLGTVTFTCLNIAAYMGFQHIYLLGVDHNYRVTINEDGKTVVDTNAKDYFCNDYDLDIKNHVVHDMGQNTIAYRKAKAYCDLNGIYIYNATRGGKLEVFPRVDFDCLFDQE